MGTSTEQTKDAKTVSPAIRANEHVCDKQV